MAHYDFKVEEKQAQPVLAMRKRSSVQQLPAAIGAAYGAIAAYLAELREHPAGPPYTAYYNTDMDDLDVEMGFPVALPLEAKGDIQSLSIPAGRYLSCMYKGPYDQMEAAYKALAEYAAANSLEPCGMSYEIYFNGPEVPPEELLTQIVFPLK